MKIYISLLLLTMIFLIIHKKTTKKLFGILPYAAMSFVSGFRNGVGVDYDTYKHWFYDILDKKGWYSNTEVGYKKLVETVANLGGNYQVVFLIMAVITSCCYYSFIKRNSKNFELSTMIYMCFGIFYFSSFNCARQTLAISLFLYSLKFIKCEEYTKNNGLKINAEKKELKSGLVKYIVFILIATLVHTSSFIFIFFPFIIKRVNNAHLLHFGVITIIGTVLIRIRVLDYLLLRLFPSYYRYASYNAIISRSYIIFLVAGMLIMIMCIKYNSIDEPLYMHLLIFSVSLIAIMYLTGKYGMLLARYASWGFPSIIILIPRLSKIVKQKKIYNSLVYAMCFSYFFMTILTGERMLPYNFNFNLFG